MKPIQFFLTTALGCSLCAMASSKVLAQSGTTTISIDWGAEIVAPTDGTTLTSSTVTFQWTPLNYIELYWLRLGTTPGGQDLLDRSMGQQTSFTVTGLPVTGRPIYATLWSYSSGQWDSSSSQYLTAGAAAQAARISSPADGSTFPGSSVTFSWSPVGSGLSYYLWVGSSQNGHDLASQAAGTATSLTVTNLPEDGRPIFVTLWTWTGSAWQPSTSQYHAASSATQIVSPVAGSTFPGSSVTLTWKPVAQGVSYYLWVGTAQDGHDLVNQSVGTATSATLTDLPVDGRSIFVTLWTWTGSAWQGSSSVYRAASGTSNASVAPGLEYWYYEATFTTAAPKTFDSVTPVESGISANFDLSHAKRGTQIGMVFIGWLKVDVAGSYTLFTTSDDGSQLFIDGALVVDNDGFHGATEKSGSKDLAAGYHRIEVTFYQGDGPDMLEVDWSGPGINRQIIPSNQLFHSVSGQ